MTLSAVLGFKRLAFAVGALVLGVFGALAVVSFLIPKDHVREAVKSEIRAATGLDPSLRGDVSVSLFPYGQVTLTDVALGEGASEPPLQAARLVARLSFLPLLLGRIDVADITLAEPQSYKPFMSLLKDARVAITDSGGLQEETTYLGIPCLTLRDNTERPVTVTEGTNRLVKADALVGALDAALAAAPGTAKRPEFWDGRTAERCVADLVRRGR